MDRSLTLNDRDAPSTFKYIAVLPHVREIALFGTADLAFWKDRLAEDDWFPLDFGGQARVLISAIESRFLGVRFGEISIPCSPGEMTATAAKTACSWRWLSIRRDSSLPSSVPSFSHPTATAGSASTAHRHRRHPAPAQPDHPRPLPLGASSVLCPPLSVGALAYPAFRELAPGHCPCRGTDVAGHPYADRIGQTGRAGWRRVSGLCAAGGTILLQVIA
jgi:hypothetical protein